VRAGRFREDLFYRLNVLAIDVPPLRERRDDIPALAYYLLARASAKHGRDVREIGPEAMDALVRWHWPGNVRELENALERAVVLGRGGRVGVGDLPEAIGAAKGWRAGEASGAGLGYRAARQLALSVFERAFVAEKLALAGGNISEAARLAGLDRANFRRIMKRLRDDG
jgi:DNA-binding NtrC family response regulator